jgi:hypothetical protein
MDPTENSSSTWEKARVLGRVIRGDQRPLVIAFGTAASPCGPGVNGNVIIGTDVFVHDPYETPPDPKRHWTHPRLNQLVQSEARPLVDGLPRQFVKKAEKRLLTPPNSAAAPPRISADSELISVGVVNVTNSADYVWTDKQALARFSELASLERAGSLETTHGLIRLALDLPFIYVSGISNAVGMFPEHVGRSQYSQTFSAAHNAAISLAWLLPELAAALSR